jgi:hypothetical protein
MTSDSVVLDPDRGTLPVQNPDPQPIPFQANRELSSRVSELADAVSREYNPAADFRFPSNRFAVRVCPRFVATVEIQNADPSLPPMTVFRVIPNPPASIVQMRDFQFARLRPAGRHSGDRSPSVDQSTEIDTSAASSAEFSEGENSGNFVRPTGRSFAGPYDTGFMQDNTDSMLRRASFKPKRDARKQQEIARSIFERDIARMEELRRKLKNPPE